MFSLLGSQRVPYIFFTPTFIALINYWKIMWCLTVIRGFQVLPTFFSDMYSELLSKDRGICTFAIAMSKVKLPSPSLTAGKLIALDNVAVRFLLGLWFHFKQHTALQRWLFICSRLDQLSPMCCTFFSLRFNKDLLRRFCSATGYGWDYPDIEFRDIPLCYPETLCLRIFDILISAEKFRLSPLGK